MRNRTAMRPMEWDVGKRCIDFAKKFTLCMQHARNKKNWNVHLDFEDHTHKVRESTKTRRTRESYSISLPTWKCDEHVQSELRKEKKNNNACYILAFVTSYHHLLGHLVTDRISCAFIYFCIKCRNISKITKMELFHANEEQIFCFEKKNMRRRRYDSIKSDGSCLTWLWGDQTWSRIMN